MTSLADVRDDGRYRVRGDGPSFTVSRRSDAHADQQAFGALTNRLMSDPVPDYDHEIRIDYDTGRPFEILFSRRR